MTTEFYYFSFSECRKNLKLCKFVSKTHNDQLTPLFNSNVLVSWSQKLNIHFIVCLLFRGTMNITSTIRVCITKEKTRIKCAFGNAHLKMRVRKKRACVLRLRRTHISGLHCKCECDITGPCEAQPHTIGLAVGTDLTVTWLAGQLQLLLIIIVIIIIIIMQSHQRGRATHSH